MELRAYSPEACLDAYPFAMKSLAAARAEEEAEGRDEVLLWFDRDSLILGDLASLALPKAKSLGFRPVNVRNIGLPKSEALDPFWSRAYALAGLDEARAGETRAYLGDEVLRFYMAAGLVAARPERGVLRKWAELCRLYAADGEIAGLCEKDWGHRLFMHQAALSLAAALLVPEAERLEYGDRVMYPLNLMSQDTEGRKPAGIDEVLTLRYDASLEGSEWRRLPMSEALRSWLEARLGQAAT